MASLSAIESPQSSLRMFLVPLLLLTVHAQSTLSQDAVGAAASKTRSSVISKRYTNSGNITILHEVHEPSAEGHIPAARPLVLNTHEVLPVKPSKKKPYTLFEKDIIGVLEKPRPLKEYELHPVTFDFNLGDLEDLAHDSIKKGDLSTEEKHLLRNPTDAGLTYIESPVDGEDDVDNNDSNVVVDVEDALDAITTSGQSTLAAGSSSSSRNSATDVTPPGAHPPVATVVTVSPHIFKIIKNKSSKKGRELLKMNAAPKSSGANFNSISRYFGSDIAADANATAESLHATVNVFQIVTNLFDHFYWQTAEISKKVTTGCGLEMQAYLTALHANYEWAQRAYDASGRYRGQLLFGNDKWVGQKTFCYELGQPLKPEERRHFEFEFYVAIVELHLHMPHNLNIALQVGECLPKSCNSHDIRTILSLDPHAHMLETLSVGAGNATLLNTTHIQVQTVRRVPGIYSFWRDLKFQIFASFMLSLLMLVVAATLFQARLNERQLTTPIRAISANVDAGNMNTSGGGGGGKAFELYQMNTIGDNNNVVEIETECAATKESKTPAAGHSNGCNSNRDDPSARPQTAQQASLDKSQMLDYKLDSASSAGATGTYEAKKQLGLHEQFLLCFAFQTNAAAILNIDESKESQTSCVHGLRVLSLLWTIMVHTYLQMFTIGENKFQRTIVERSMWYQFVGNATFSVDTFFFISGFLVTLLYLKQEKKYPDGTGQFARRGTLDALVIIFYRYIRLTPAYLFVIFFNDFSVRQVFDASVFQPSFEHNTCAQYWWRNILYINNFYPLGELCMIWSWYMANDMQFYVMATILLILSTRYFKTAVLTVVTFLLSSWAVAGIVSLHHHYTHKVADPFESFDFLYDKPWQRVGTYIIGMLAGYILYKVKTPPHISRRLNGLLWAASLALLALIIFGVWDGELSELGTAFYVSIGHTAFGVGLVWIVLSCCWGLAPTFNRILSYRGLWPLSRLTYCTYLIHPVIMLITSYRMSGAVHLNNLFVMTIFLGNAVVSFGVAFFISVLFEAPVIRLLKICFRRQ